MTPSTAAGEFADRRVLVTGAARNTGFALARAFVREGARVFLNGRAPEAVRTAVERLNDEGHPGHAVAAPADVGNPGEVDRMFAAIADDGGLDVLVNNAVVQGIGGSFEAVDDALLEEVFRVNVFGYFRCGRAAARMMKARGGGAIVNLGSNVARRAIRKRSAYVASKGAIESLTLAMAVDLAPTVRVNLVVPGYIRTDRWDTLPEATAKRRWANIPLGAEAEGEDIAAAVLFMASARAKNVTGARLVVDGGCSAQHMPLDNDV